MHIRIRRYCSSTDFHIDISKTASRFSIPVRIVRALMPHSISRTPEHCSRCWHTLGWPEMSDRWRTRTLARSVAGVRVKSMRSQPIWPLCAMSKYSLPLPLPSIVIINCVMCIFLVAPIRNRTCWWCIRSACCACPAVHRMTIFVRYQRCVATMRTASNVAISRRSAKRPTKREQEAERERERESAKSRRRNESNHERDRERERMKTIAACNDCRRLIDWLMIDELLRYRKTMWNLTCDLGFVGIFWNLNWCRGLYIYKIESWVER